MQNNIKEIIPECWIGCLKFGMTRDEVKKIAGKPDDVENLPDLKKRLMMNWSLGITMSMNFHWFLMQIMTGDWCLLR
ncbi:MAG: hypothetical protein IPN86_11760 [Saprospiraceae bacterium]|nr:hypothetical protein [Saprospiraceae bacterium]